MDVSPLLIAVVAIVIGVPIALIVLFNVAWRVAGPSEAGIITGLGIKGVSGDGSDAFRIVSGGGKMVLPVLQRWETLSLAQHSASLRVDAVDKQKISTGASGVVLFKINDDPVSITNSARRYLDGAQSIDDNVREVFQGHLRSILGSLTIEELIEDRALLARKVREACDTEMQAMGLKIDSLQISEIHDPSGYIAALGAPQTAMVKMQARIAEAQRDREATEREQEAEALKAEAVRVTQIKRAEYQAQVDRAQADAAQSGPLADASARKQVVVEETEVAKLQASRTEQELRSTVVKQAEAEATQTRLRAEAGRDARIAAAEAQASETEKSGAAQALILEATGRAEAAATQAKGLADGEATRARGLAEAEALSKRADAMQKNQEAVIGQQIAEKMPQIVEAAASAFHGVDQLTVLNGAQGISEILNQVIAQAGSSLTLAKDLLATPNEASGNGGSGDHPARTDVTRSQT